MAALPGQVSAVTPLADAIDGSPRPRPRRAAVRPERPDAPEVARFCRRCGFRDPDPYVMHRHMTKEIAAVEDELAQLRLDRGESHMVTPEEAAAARGFHINTVRKLCRDGTLRSAVEIGGRWLLDLREIEEYQPQGGGGWEKRTDGRVCPSATNEEIGFLRSHQDWTAPELAAHLGHSIDWVRDRRRFMRRLEGEDAWPKLTFTRTGRMRTGDDQADRICDLARDGRSLEQIEAGTGVAISSIRRILRENHVRTAGQAAWASGTKHGPAAVSWVKKLRAEGKSWRQIAETTGLPTSTCRMLAVLDQGSTVRDQRREQIRSEILDAVTRAGGLGIGAVISATLGGNHAGLVRGEIRHLVDDGRLTETRTAKAKILTVSSPGPRCLQNAWSTG